MSQDVIDKLLGMVAMVALGALAAGFVAFTAAVVVIGTLRLIEILGGGG